MTELFGPAVAPYALLLACGIVPTAIWRLLAVLMARGLSDNSPIIVWVRLVATTLLTAVVTKLILAPPGAMQQVPLAGRVGAVAVAFFIFVATRSIILALVLGEAVVIGATWWALR